MIAYIFDNFIPFALAVIIVLVIWKTLQREFQGQDAAQSVAIIDFGRTEPRRRKLRTGALVMAEVLFFVAALDVLHYFLSQTAEILPLPRGSSNLQVSNISFLINAEKVFPIISYENIGDSAAYSPFRKAVYAFSHERLQKKDTDFVMERIIQNLSPSGYEPKSNNQIFPHKTVQLATHDYNNPLSISDFQEMEQSKNFYTQ